LARKVNVIPAAAKRNLKQALISDKIIPGAETLPITKQLDDALKRSKHIIQRTQFILPTITRLQKVSSGSTDPGKKNPLYRRSNYSRISNHVSLPPYIKSKESVKRLLMIEEPTSKPSKLPATKKNLMLISNIKQKYWSNK